MISRDELESLARLSLPAEAGRIADTLDSLCTARVATFLRECGWKFPAAVSVLEVAIPEQARAPFRALIRHAVTTGLLKLQDGVVRPAAALARQKGYGESVALLGNALELDPIGFQWLCRGLDALGPVLRGYAMAEELLFPGGDLKLASDVYARSAVFSFYSRLPSEIARFLGRNSGFPLRILEVGAGLGATAREVLAASEPGSVERYFCTDVARVILAQAQRQPAPPELSFALFDVDRPDWPANEKVDLILALNVLHLSKDPERAIDNLVGLLRPGGSLVVSEISPPEGTAGIPWIDFTFGLLPSFHRSARPGGPLLAPETWKSILAGPGSAPVLFSPLRAENRVYGGVYVRTS